MLSRMNKPRFTGEVRVGQTPLYLLDTNVISELRSGKAQQSQTVRAWAARQPINELYLSAITVMEMEIGVMPVAQFYGAKQGKALINGKSDCQRLALVVLAADPSRVDAALATGRAYTRVQRLQRGLLRNRRDVRGRVSLQRIGGRHE